MGDDAAPLGPDALDSRGLGRFRRVEGWRDVWPKEAGHFTPWLYQNVNVLGEALGMKLTAVDMEVPVGEFRLDIKAEDDDGNVVVIENQLERTDHSHLGQCLVYAARLRARTVVWVATKFRHDFRAVLDWLNERTDENVRFFGVEVGLVRISDGPAAPWFEVVCRPNDWAKGPGDDGMKGLGPASSGRRQEFLVDVISALRVRLPGVRFPSAEVQRRYTSASFARGPFGNWDVTLPSGQVGVGAYINLYDPRFGPDQVAAMNKALFDHMVAGRAHWQEATGSRFPLIWEPLPKRAYRIYANHPLDLSEEASARTAKDWAVDALEAMFSAMNDELRAWAADIKRAASPVMPDTRGRGADGAEDGQGASLGDGTTSAT
jgi:hypothetical protein